MFCRHVLLFRVLFARRSSVGHHLAEGFVCVKVVGVRFYVLFFGCAVCWCRVLCFVGVGL